MDKLREEFWLNYNSDLLTKLEDIFIKISFLNFGNSKQIAESMVVFISKQMDDLFLPALVDYITIKNTTDLTYKEQYNNFFSNSFENILSVINSNFSKIMQFIIILKRNWLYAINHLFYCFERDIERLEDCFKISKKLIQSIVVSGDFHGLNRATCIIKFDDSSGFIYKPIDARVDNFINSFLYDKKNLIFVNQDNDYYTYMEYLQPELNYNSIDICSKIFFDYGKLIAFGSFFNITDGHCQNIIITNKEVYWIDLETAFDFSYQHQEFQKESIERTLLIQKRTNEHDYIISGLQGGLTTITSISRPTLVLTDKTISINWANKYCPDFYNGVFLNNNRQNPFHHFNYIKEGFLETYNKIMLNKNDYIEKFNNFIHNNKNLKVRVVFGNTKDYQLIKNFLFHMAYDKQDQFKIIANKRIQLLKKILGRYCDDKVINFIIQCELMDLSNHVIPYFYRQFEDKRLYHISGLFVENAFENTLEQSVLDYWNHYELDLAKNLSIIYNYLATTQ